MADIFYEARPFSSDQELISRSRELYGFMNRRRSIRQFSDRPIPEEVLKNCIRTAGTAPSGANQQPWTFVLVKDPEVKRILREEAERVEYSFYSGEGKGEWKDALRPLGTGYRKPFLERAPYLIVVFVQKYGRDDDGSKITHYYAQKSVGIATGMLITALHGLGISALTYTPGSMQFLQRILHRPDNESPYMVLVVGYPDEGARVPDIERKPLDRISVML
jgi:nitroreductase